MTGYSLIARYSDLQDMLTQHGFERQEVASMPSPSQSFASTEIWRHPDGREVNLGVSLSSPGFKEVHDINASHAGENISPINTIEDFIGWIGFAHNPQAPSGGTETVEAKIPSETLDDLKDGGLTAIDPGLLDLSTTKTILLRSLPTASNPGGVSSGVQQAAGGQVKIEEEDDLRPTQNPQWGGHIQSEEMMPHKCEEEHPDISHSAWLTTQ